jgi:signal transduction histidine kinase
VEYEGPGLSRRTIPDSALRHATVDGATGGTNYAAGLAYLGYEGNWEKLPDFTKLRPRKTGVATNFDLNVRMCDEYTGLRFNGFIEVPQDGLYTFHLASDDGSRLFVGEPSVDVRVLADRPAPPALESAPAASPAATNQGWVTLEGTVNFASVREDAGGLQLQVGKDEVRVELFDSHGPAPDFSAHSKVRISGVYRGVNSGYGSPVQCLMQALDWRAIRSAPFAGPNPAPAMSPDAANGRAAATGRTETTRITTVAEIKVLSPELADRQLPVSIRGVVTALPGGGNIVLQDATGGIYVVLSFLQTLDKFEPPRVGELCQIDGFTVRGLFTPLVIPRQITHLGTGLFPEPQRATREELMNGSLDTEYAEIEGVVTAVYGRQIELLMEGGPVTLELDRLRPEVLAGHEHALVQIRGCVFSPCDVQTHRLAWGTIHIGAPAVNFLQLARRDPFDTPPTSMGDLLLYKPKTAPFRWLKVSGQVLHVRDREFFLSDGTNGVHALTADSAPFSVGDRVDVAGYIELGGAVAEIREAVMRKTGHAPLPAPKKLATRQLLQAGNAGTLVAVDATLMNQWREGSEQVLELQADFLVFRARIDGRGHRIALPPTGSQLALTGVYVPRGRSSVGKVSGFDLLLDSPDRLRVLTTPSWWTLERVLILSAVLAAVLATLLGAVLMWNRELSRKVRARTRQLEQEIFIRQQTEQQRAAEAERARIARDLHDELGTGLTVVSLLASAGLGDAWSLAKTGDRLGVIAEKARTLVSSLDVIVWAIDPAQDSLQSFVDYLRSYAQETLSVANIVCRFRIPIECHQVALTGRERHSMLLAVKEALNNVVRHAAATEVDLQTAQLGNHLEIVITDNGCGFNGNATRRGHGLTNLRERLEALRGHCQVESQPGGGTRVKLTVPLPTN